MSLTPTACCWINCSDFELQQTRCVIPNTHDPTHLIMNRYRASLIAWEHNESLTASRERVHDIHSTVNVSLI